MSKHKQPSQRSLFIGGEKGGTGKANILALLKSFNPNDRDGANPNDDTTNQQ